MSTRKILVCDSGSTKADWLYTDSTGEYQVRTKGLNPVRDSLDIIQETLSEVPSWTPDEVFFYGAGCIPPYSNTLAEALSKRFPKAAIQVESDMLGAARALFGMEEGIACILGTGSNSCLCQDGNIVRQIPSLGYILGDEGSGAVLGRRLVGDLLKGQLPQKLRDAFYEEYELSQSIIIDKVYRQPAANRFLASLCPFIAKHKDEEGIQKLLSQEFERFLTRNVLQYGRSDLKISYVGGISVHFEDELRAAHDRLSLEIGAILSAPAKKMMVFHQKRAF